ncbi:hypothetical protein BC829DRAFT_403908 [Chytridium lagenaria]|nr:hypothetical protein BC829DRAFT_403908 [Chytridium lagenaria]
MRYVDDAMTPQHDQNINVLAAEKRAENPSVKSFSVPIWVVLIFLMTGVIVTIIVPIALLFVDSSTNTISYLTSVAIPLAATKAIDSVETSILNKINVLQSLIRQPYFLQDFIANKNNISASPTAFLAMLRSVRLLDYFTMRCETIPVSPEPAFGPFGPYPNNTFVAVGYTTLFATVGMKRMIVLYADPSTGGSSRLETYAQDFTLIDKRFTGSPAPDLMGVYAKLRRPNVQPYFEVLSVTRSTGDGFSELGYYEALYLSTPDIPTLLCSSSLNIQETFVPMLKSAQITENTVVIFAERSTGLLIATNDIKSSYFNNTRMRPDLSPNRQVSLIGKGIITLYGSLSNVPDGEISVRQVRLDDGREWFVSTQVIHVKGTEFVLSLGFPRTDMFSIIDAAKQQSIVIASLISAIGILILSVLSYVSLRPLHHMAVSMKQLTQFDFSVLENGGLERRSHMMEIREVEATFDTMIMAFAAAVREGKEVASLARRPSMFPRRTEGGEGHLAGSESGEGTGGGV